MPKLKYGPELDTKVNARALNRMQVTPAIQRAKDEGLWGKFKKSIGGWKELRQSEIETQLVSTYLTWTNERGWKAEDRKIMSDLKEELPSIVEALRSPVLPEDLDQEETGSGEFIVFETHTGGRPEESVLRKEFEFLLGVTKAGYETVRGGTISWRVGVYDCTPTGNTAKVAGREWTQYNRKGFLFWYSYQRGSARFTDSAWFRTDAEMVDWKRKINLIERAEKGDKNAVIECLEKDILCDAQLSEIGTSSTSHEVLDRLAVNRKWTIRQSVAWNTSTPLKTLEVLAKDKHEYVRAAAIESIAKIQA